MNKNSGFTLIELLVVLGLAILLFGLLFPSIIQMNRGPSRRSTCMNNQKNIALASLNYEDTNKFFPGYVLEITQKPSGKSIKVSWIVHLLPYLERQDLYEQWMTSEHPAAPLMQILQCPSNPPPVQDKNNAGWLAYRINTGRNRPNTNLDNFLQISQGVSTDQYPGDSVPAGQEEKINRVSTGYISAKDGTTYTLLLGELDSQDVPMGRWDITLSSKDNNTAIDGDEVSLLGFNWASMDKVGKTIDALHPAQSTATVADKINSNHPGIAIVSFCDGHQKAMRTNIDIVTFMQLMAPNDRHAVENVDNSNQSDGISIRDLSGENPAPKLDENNYF